ncbi:dTDP-L-rhamnose 4-epimerase [Cryobacterium sp. MP_M5]|uniref:NAD-dependent epimerase/dehydratase family protein n=1 Tax=unclassified Cryobacterium TaxID=2649013 RepID=UPI0018C9142A|nr:MULTISPECIES: NAD-dependent epimerase/dehydratase family protein [unclassified Cryobacterium]MBG6058500.1 dTDP-L-rhamnose 4-epimerase [Cryobacterium sp. MP_M3]MEC5178252.1 dTDP-L-rhamnose 4-epimerase [Cryobacterium sp. MP_M5]
MNAPRLLVTGGAGFIGGAIVSAALERGWRVRVLDSLRSDVHGALPVVDPRVDVIVGDVTDPGVVAVALREVDLVCHQAAKVGLGVDFFDAPDYVRSNEVGTAVLLAAMTAAGIDRLVLASSMVVYGEGSFRGSRGPARPGPRRGADLTAGVYDPVDEVTGERLQPALTTEEDPLDPRNVYAATKLAQEYLASAWARATGGRVAALRYHNVYGPGMPQNTPYAGVASLFRSALERGEAPRVFEDGAQRRDFVHVADIASANLAALDWTADSAASTFRAFNVGSGTVHTIGDMAEALSRASGGPDPVITGEFRLGDVRHITASSERIRTELGWAPTVTFERGVAEFATAPLRAAVRR